MCKNPGYNSRNELLAVSRKSFPHRLREGIFRHCLSPEAVTEALGVRGHHAALLEPPGRGAVWM